MEQTPVPAQVHIYATPDEVARAAGQALAAAAIATAARTGRFALALSGGETPRRLYRVLAEEYGDALPWAKIHLFWGDDRFVPADDPASNIRLVRETLLAHVSIPAINVHPMPVFFQDPGAAAADYEATLRAYWRTPWPRFDLMLQGLGSDGHTASLFPQAPALAERQRWVVSVREERVQPPRRLTVTLPVINNAARVHFIVTGAAKAEVVARVLAGETTVEETPAAGVRPADGELVWWLDEAAAAGLRSDERG